MHTVSLLFLLLLCVSDLGALDIRNHLGEGMGMRDALPTQNTLIMTLFRSQKNNLEKLDQEKFLRELKFSLEDDHCTLSFSGWSGAHLIIQFHCDFLNNTGRETVSERAQLPLLKNLGDLLRVNSFVEKHKEYIRVIRRPSLWSGNYEGMDKSMGVYFRNLKRPKDEINRAEELVRRKKLYPDNIHSKFIQAEAPWGLDRIDSRYGDLDNQYHYESGAPNSVIYVMDTGVNANHEEFTGGRAINLVNTVGDGINTDCNGHGTHVASIAAGQRFGVAKEARIFAVKVLDCGGNGDTFTVATGAMAIREHLELIVGSGAVVSMSLGGEASSAINSAVLSLVNDGVTVVVAAGNEHSDACSFSPSSLGESSAVITVGASDMNDGRPGYSNYGRCVVVSAPGDGITGADYSTNTGTLVLSGTSMATPHVSGVAALVLQQDPLLSPSQVRQAIVSWSTPNIVTGASPLGGGKNLLYSLIVLTNDPPEDPPSSSNPQPQTNSPGDEDSSFTSSAPSRAPSGIIYLTLLTIYLIQFIIY